jgi:polysaccharide export outer membrane protein
VTVATKRAQHENSVLCPGRAGEYDSRVLVGTFRWIAVVGALAAASIGCGSTGPYVWAKDLPPEEAVSSTYLIASGDVVGVRVFNQEPMSTRTKVRTDGRISVPLLGDVDVRGKAPVAVAKEIETRLKDFINSPIVTVTVEEFQAVTVSIIGEVGHPGTYPLDQNASLLTALANAGGLTENASRDSIFVLREAPVPRRIRLTYDWLTQSVPSRATTFRLRSGDVVVVE